MLKQRVITALILAPLVVWGIIALPTAAFEILVGAIVLLGGWEWSRLAGLDSRLQRSGFLLVLMAGLLALWNRQNQSSTTSLFMGLVVLWWVITLLRLLHYRQHPVKPGVQCGIAVVAGLIVLGGTFLALLRLRVEFGAASILVLLILIWGADTAAYFAGRKWGRHKLLVNVSPGKSWEGVYGALLATLLLAFVSRTFIPVAMDNLLLFLLLALVTVIFSIVGDLNESLYKRQAGLKDSGQLLPGHGGILDRIDSLTAAAPVFYAGLQVMPA
jgi:phosphatidate cytidylyltransferase